MPLHESGDDDNSDEKNISSFSILNNIHNKIKETNKIIKQNMILPEGQTYELDDSKLDWFTYNNHCITNKAERSFKISEKLLKNKVNTWNFKLTNNDGLLSQKDKIILVKENSENEILKTENEDNSLLIKINNCVENQLPMKVQFIVELTCNNSKIFKTSIIVEYTNSQSFAYIPLPGFFNFFNLFSFCSENNNFASNKKLAGLINKYNFVIQAGILQNLPEKKTLIVDNDQSLSKDLVAMLRDETLSDIKLLVNYAKEIKAHKVVLASRSAYFAKLFANEDFSDVSKGCVEINNIKTEVFEELLYFIYSNELSHLEQYASDLLVAAEYYAIDSLKKICINHLCSVISVENFCQLLLLSNQYKVDELKKSCLEYFKRDLNYKAIVKTSAWTTVMVSSPEMLAIMMQIMCELM